MNKIELESLYTLHCVSGPISERLQGQLANQFPRGAPKRCTYLTHSAASSPANAPFPQVLWSTYVIYVCGGVFFFFLCKLKAHFDSCVRGSKWSITLCLGHPFRVLDQQRHNHSTTAGGFGFGMQFGLTHLGIYSGKIGQALWLI